MRTAVDTNILSMLWSGEQLTPRVSAALAQAYDEGGLVISAPVYAELVAHPKATPAQVDEFLKDTGIEADFVVSERAWREIASRFSQYAIRRRASRGRAAKRLLADFIVGAHALVQADRLLTLDKGRYQRDFPELELFSM